MPRTPFSPTDSVVDFHLLGEVPFDDCLALQRRLVYEVSNSGQRRAVVLLCEHSRMITVGRFGSRSHIRITGDELEHQQLPIRWINRTGGCIPHAPGQLAVYPIVPLDIFRWTQNDYLTRLRAALIQAFRAFNVSSQVSDCGDCISGRHGVPATIGFAVQEATTYFGAYINVAPAMDTFARIDTTALPGGKRAAMSCLLAERRLPVRMTDVRTRMIESIVDAFAFERYHIHTGHPWLRYSTGTIRESTANAR